MAFPRHTDASRSLAALRDALRPVESIPGEARIIPFGIAMIDSALGGGLAGGMLHEIAASSENELAAATGFALALVCRANWTSNPLAQASCLGLSRASTSYTTRKIKDVDARDKPGHDGKAVVWIAEDMAFLESGAPYGPGLDDWLSPRQIILVRVPKSRDVAWAMEEALRCRAVGAVIGEVRGSLDLVATRRLSLAAGRGGAPGLLLRAVPGAEPSAAATRWIVAAAPSGGGEERTHSLGLPRFFLRLVRNRRGHLGSWMLEWNRAQQRFDPAPAHFEPVAPPVLDRPHRAIA